MWENKGGGPNIGQARYFIAPRFLGFFARNTTVHAAKSKSIKVKSSELVKDNNKEGYQLGVLPYLMTKIYSIV